MSIDGTEKSWSSRTSTRNKQGAVRATVTWRERTLPSETGHILRHTYRTLAQRMGMGSMYLAQILPIYHLPVSTPVGTRFARNFRIGV